MNYITIYREGEFQHFYGTSRNPEAMISSLMPRSKPVLVHFHSSILTCRGGDHALLLPESSAKSTRSDRGPTPEDSTAVV